MSIRNVEVKGIKNLPVGKNLSDYIITGVEPYNKASSFKACFFVPKDKLDELIRNGAIITY